MINNYKNMSEFFYQSLGEINVYFTVVIHSFRHKDIHISE